jgi:Na+-transporting methylmalonyl-CoA/oxaloacetate decarboxylase gamma subunit
LFLAYGILALAVAALGAAIGRFLPKEIPAATAAGSAG